MSPRSIRRIKVAVLVAACLAALWADAQTQTHDPPGASAGPFTTSVDGPEAYSIPVSMLTPEQAERFAAGKEQFNEAWVVAPDPSGVWGLGPTFNEDRCVHCHVQNGRASAAADGAHAERGLLVRLSVSGQTAHGAPNAHPVYGDQLQNRGIADRVPPEGEAIFSYVARRLDLSDGDHVELREPRIEFRNLRFGKLDADAQVSPRIATALIGLGLLEAVPEESIRAMAAAQPPEMRGKPNVVWDIENERQALGRFGWKASQPSIRQQVAAAFLGDIGATTSLFPEENCPSVQTACLDLPSASKCGGQGGCSGNYRPEVIPSRLTNITLYLQTLAVPARRNLEDPKVQRGEALFAQTKCSVCHVPELRTGADAAVPAAANLVFHPYTDLLLHDMGDALADGRPDFQASGREWRTPPLWGIGLSQAVNGHTDLLHDGRARNVTEAILWHDGQALGSRQAFQSLPKADREALVRFVESL